MSAIGSYQPRMSQTWVDSTRNAFHWTAIFISDISAFAIALLIACDWNSTSGLADLWSDPNQRTRAGIFIFLAAAWIIWFGVIKRSYLRRKPHWTELEHLTLGVAFFCVADLALVAVAQMNIYDTWWASAWLSLMVLLPITRWSGTRLIKHMGLWYKPTVIIGSGHNARQAFFALKTEPGMGFDVQAFAAPTAVRTSGAVQAPIAGVPYMALGLNYEDAPLLRPFRCVIALDAEESELRDSILRQLVRNGITDVHVIPAMRGVPLHGVDTSHFFRHDILLIHLENNLAHFAHRALKRLFDIFGSMALLALLSPVFLYLTFKISRDGGRAIFSHRRVGYDKKPFDCHKFRTMVLNSQEVLEKLLASDPTVKAEWDREYKLKADPRVTKNGLFLRRTSLDELPQLWNVFKGEMSLVGPRPVTVAEIERYGNDAAYYATIKPGMTGIWQVSGRNDVDYSTRVYLDAWYVKNWSLWLDISILFETISVVLKRKGSY